MKIIFRINYHTHWGENIFISGSSEMLGKWNPDESFPMNYLGHGEWEAAFVTDTDEAFEYKYIVRANNQKPVWEGGNNRIFSLNGRAAVEIRDFWHPLSDPYQAHFSKVFTDVLMKPICEHPIARVAPTKPALFLSLAEPCVPKNKTVAVVGNQKAMGSWEKPVIMGNTNYPAWQIEFDLSKFYFPIIYKYVLLDHKTGKISEWENGEPRHIFHIDSKQKGFCHIQNDYRLQSSNLEWRGAGVAVPVFSLRTEESFGVGEFNDIKKLVDWADRTGLKMVQVLPVNETVATHSWLDSYPYKAISVIALHPMYLNLQLMGTLRDERLRDEFDLLRSMLNAKPHVDYVEVTRLKSRYYKLIFDQEWKNTSKTEEYRAFFEANKEWLKPYAAFCFLRDRYKTGDFRAWNAWSKYDPEKIEELVNPKSKHHEHIAVHYFIQYHLDKQLRSSVEYAHSKGIALKGDIPIGISPNSIEAWALPKLFNLNGQAGAPPDDFSVLGQNWGFPTYNWDDMALDGFLWWKNRLAAMSKYFDAYRIDHILGFFRIWEIPIDAIHGLLGYFKPALPLTPDEIQDWGIWFDTERFVKPHITHHLVQTYFGEYTDEVLALYLTLKEDGRYKLKNGFRTQKEIYNHFTPGDDSAQVITEKNVVLRDGLMSLLDEVIFIEDPYSKAKAYHPRIAMQLSNSFLELDHELKNRLNDLYIDFYYRRHDQYWKEEAFRKLPSIISASNMLVCGEDLGMVPDSVPEVMRPLNILSLEIQRMPKNPDIEFGNPSDAPYLSVCTTSTHDMSTIRGWWEENHDKTQRFFHNILGQNGQAPFFAEPWVCREIIFQHLNSPAMWTIFPIQDLIAIDGDLRWDETDKERINVPSDERNKWRYRMILSLEELTNAMEFNSNLHNMVKRSDRMYEE
jgi:4-alpha-glucanotransferase